MGKRCKHRSPWGYRRAMIVDGEIKYMLFSKCDCGHWLSLGPANITPEVEVEIRAAKLAVQPAGTYVTSDAQSGWVCHEQDLDPPWPHCPDAWAGYLARCIATHEEP